jgi:hypothetical protein
MQSVVMIDIIMLKGYQGTNTLDYYKHELITAHYVLLYVVMLSVVIIQMLC